MGAWSEEPAGNDEAQEWIANAIEHPIAEVIKNVLNLFLEDGSDDVRKAEVQAAVALLLDLTSNGRGFKYVSFGFDYVACELALWDKAIAAIRALQSETKWLAGWSHPQKKADVLSELLADLEVSKKRTAKKNGSGV